MIGLIGACKMADDERKREASQFLACSCRKLGHIFARKACAVHAGVNVENGIELGLSRRPQSGPFGDVVQRIEHRYQTVRGERRCRVLWHAVENEDSCGWQEQAKRDPLL